MAASLSTIAVLLVNLFSSALNFCFCPAVSAFSKLLTIALLFVLSIFLIPRKSSFELLAHSPGSVTGSIPFASLPLSLLFTFVIAALIAPAVLISASKFVICASIVLPFSSLSFTLAFISACCSFKYVSNTFFPSSLSIEFKSSGFSLNAALLSNALSAS